MLYTSHTCIPPPIALEPGTSPQPGDQTCGGSSHILHCTPVAQDMAHTVRVFDVLTASLIKRTVPQDLEAQNQSSVLYFAKGKDRLATNIWTDVVKG